MQYISKLVGIVLAVLLSVPAWANYNTKYGEIRFNELPLRGRISKSIWVGSWWAYSDHGLSHRHNATGDMKNDAKSVGGWTVTDRAKELSASEKYDALVGRTDKIEHEKLAEYLKLVKGKTQKMDAIIKERRILIRKLNKLIDNNADTPGFDWKLTADGKRYTEITEAIEATESDLSTQRPKIDTATEWEVFNHGGAQFGLGSWWGHCNAWSAASIMEPEPRNPTTVDGITFTPGDIKGLLTELWMEHQSNFHGSRNDYHGDKEARAAIDFNDVTPATFHIRFADQIGNHDKSFVIDRYTGDQVWNQPVKGFRSSYDVLNDGQAVRRQIKQTKYSNWRPASIEDMGVRDVYEVLMTTTIHWVTDGVPHEELNVDHLTDADLSDADYRNGAKISALTNNQVHVRTLTYVLWLDKHPNDSRAEIIGDGQWRHGNTTGYTALHPDFIWQPLGQRNTARKYENEFIDYNVVVSKILAGAINPATNVMVQPGGGYSAEVPVTIPDGQEDGTEGHIAIQVPVSASGIGSLVGMTLELEIEHPHVGDLKVSIADQTGLVRNVKHYGSGDSQDNLMRTYDVNGTFDGRPADGIWTLHVWDNRPGDSGSVLSAKLNFK